MTDQPRVTARYAAYWRPACPNGPHPAHPDWTCAEAEAIRQHYAAWWREQLAHAIAWQDANQPHAFTPEPTRGRAVSIRPVGEEGCTFPIVPLPPRQPAFNLTVEFRPLSDDTIRALTEALRGRP